MSNVKLVWATPNGESLVAYMARVSNPDNQNNPDSAKLIGYLLRNKHWSPLEMVSACVEIETTRDIGRQILRHRSFSFQEFSQRYADATQLGDLEFRECRLQDAKNRQNSLAVDTANDEQRLLALRWESKQAAVQHAAAEAYKWALEHGIAKEQARALLPEGMTPSRMYMAGTLRSFIHYLQVRRDASTQKEHREIALQIAEVLRAEFPNILEAAQC